MESEGSMKGPVVFMGKLYRMLSLLFPWLTGEKIHSVLGMKHRLQVF